MAGIPQVITEDRASGAQFIDGSLKFDSSKSQYLKRKPTADGNGKLWTWSGWLKRTPGALHDIFSAGQEVTNDGLYSRFRIDSGDYLNYRQWVNTSSLDAYLVSSMKLRDPSAYFHYVAIYDSNNSTNSDKVRFYINGQRVTVFSSNDYPGGTNSSWVNSSSKTHTIGGHYDGGTSADSFFNGHMSQVYFLDGIAAGPENFGFTDPLTNTWRPKKYTGDFKIIPDNQLLYNVNTGDNGFDSGTSSRTYDATGRTFATYSAPQTANPGGYGANSAHVYKSPDGAAIDWVISTDSTDRYVWTSTDGINWTNTGVQDTDGSVVTVNTAWLAIAGGSNSTNATVTSSTAGYGLIVGHNSFYLPLDGNTPIGKDQSGNGNDWTPVNFGGSNSLEKATGALPILNTTQGGTHAGVGNFGSNVSKVIAVTVSNASGINKYYFDSVLNPTLPLIRGSIISFDTSDSSNNSHPFKLSSTNADSSGGTEYTDGVSYFVNGSQKNASDYVSQYSSHSSGFRGIKWTVPHDVSTTYYYCTSHTGMGNNGRLNSTTDITKADPFAWKCFLALPLDDPSIDKSSTLNRTSSGKAITVSGCVSSSDRSNFYGRSTFFDGSNDQLSVEAHGQLDFGADDDWTFELWFYTTTVGSGWAISDYSGNNSATGSPGGQIYFSNSSGSGLHWYQNSTKYAEIPKEEIQVNKWHHVAFVKDGTADTITSFLDGVSKTTSSFNGSSGSTSNGLIIGQQGGGTFFSGYMSDFRVYKGIKKYTNNFIPASTNPDILPDTPSGIVGKSKLTKITDGAVTGFESNSDYLTVAASSDFEFTGDHTIEMFIYHNTLAGDSVPFATGGSGSPDQLYINTTGEFYYAYGQTGAINAPAGTIVVGRWQHIAVSKQGTYLRMFVDGKMVAASPNHSSTIGSSSAVPHIGMRGDGNHFVEGFISNLRIVKGTALYTSEFIPPTAPLTEVTNTKLLCCQSNTQPGAAAVSPSGTTVWSAGTLSGSIEAVRPWALGFDGSESTFTRPVSNQMASIMFDTPISFSSKFEIRGALDSGNTGSIEVYDGTNAWINVSSSFGSYSQASQYPRVNLTSSLTSPVKGIRFNGVSAVYQPRFTGIYVDDVVLVDPLTPNGDAAATNFNPFTDDINTIRGQESGYATLNPLRNGQTLSNGNLDVVGTNSWQRSVSTINMSSGRWYWEYLITASNEHIIGVGPLDMQLSGNLGAGSPPGSGFGSELGQVNGTGANSSWSNIGQLSTGDLIGVAFDADNGKMYIYANGVAANGGIPSHTGLTDGPYEAVFSLNGSSRSGSVNFGQKPFKFPPPDGFQPLSLSNTQPEKVIARPDQYFGVSLWTGNGTSQNITGLKHKPDFVWSKARSFGADHELYDSVRGTMQRLYSSLPNPEGSPSSGVNSFNADGFGVTGGGGVNNNTSTYVGWTWKAGGNKNTFNIDDVGYANASDINMNAGALNSASYNTSDKWSDDVSGDTYGGASMPKSKLFNGALDNNVIANSGTTLTFSPSGLSSISSLRIYGSSYTRNANGIVINGTDYTSSFPQGGNSVAAWVTIPETSLTSIAWSTTGAGLENGSLYAIEVDGKLLVDNDQTPPNVPSIAPTGCSVNTKSKFGIYTYTGSGSGSGTLSHGLEGTPGLVIYKKRNSSSSWQVYHQSLGGTVYNTLDEDVGDYTGDSTRFGGTNPTSSIITLGTHGNGADDTIMYAWCDVPGLQKFGSWTGINNANGTFVELGFRPALVIAKESSATGAGAQWFMLDSSRNTYNPLNNILDANRGDGERQGVIYDFLSNGFKIRTTFNSGATFIYMAWAEAPSINLYGAQANAR